MPALVFGRAIARQHVKYTLCEPRDTLQQGKGHLKRQTMAYFWACRPLHMPEASLAADTQASPWPFPITC